jgi:hypothetical protein
MCSSYLCNDVAGNCTRTNVTCNDSNSCTVDSCSPSVGCVYSVITDQATVDSICSPNVCQNAACTSSGCNVSAIVPVPAPCSSDPCVSNPCSAAQNTFCLAAVCINNLTNSSGGYSCNSVTNATEKAVCVNFVTNGDPSIGNKKRYCLEANRVGICPANDMCTNWTCNDPGSSCGFSQHWHLVQFGEHLSEQHLLTSDRMRSDVQVGGPDCGTLQ